MYYKNKTTGEITEDKNVAQLWYEIGGHEVEIWHFSKFSREWECFMEMTQF